MKTFGESNFPGRLIAVEGLDGAGKSTQIHLLKRWLELQGLKVYFSEWSSSELVNAATSKGKRACAAGESKLQLSKSIPAVSAAAASSGDLT